MGDSTGHDDDPPHDAHDAAASSAPAQQAQLNQCLQAPIETLLESAEDSEGMYISTHDLIEAYSLFSNRIKANVYFMTENDLSLPLLVRNAPTIASVIQRDIKRIFYQPTTSDEEESYYVRDSISLCHQTLRLLSDILSAPSLYTCFPAESLRSIMTLILQISGLSSSDAPPLCRPTTIWMTIWLLKTQRLTIDIVLPLRDEIVFVLGRCIQGDAGHNKVLLDALQASDNLLQQHPSYFADALSRNVSLILCHSMSNDPDLRGAAVSTLSAFASAKLRGAVQAPTTERLIESVLAFIDPTPSASHSSKYILKLISDAMAVGDLSQPGCGPIWALCLISAVIVLADGPLFYSSRTIKTLVPPLGLCLSHRNPNVHALHAHTWNCLTWSFSHIHTYSSNRKGDPRVKTDQAYQFLSQDLRPGIGSVLVIRLFDAPEGTIGASDAVQKAFDLLRRMIQHKISSVRLEGISLLNRLLGSSPSTPPPSPAAHWCASPYLPKFLFDGSILRAKPCRHAAMIQSALPLESYPIPAFTEEQITEYWAVILELWIIAANGDSSKDETAQNHIIHSWKTLLLARAQLTQERGRFTADATLQGDITRIIADLVSPTTSLNPVVQLRFANRLVSALKNVFIAPCLSEVAEATLRRLLDCQHDFSDTNVVGAWNSLSIELLSLSGERAVDVLISSTNLETMRRLWAMLSDTWKVVDNPVAWGAIIRLLSVPFRSWTMSSSEFELWEHCLRTAVFTASSHDIGPDIVVDQFLQHIGKQRLFLLSDFPQVIVALISQLDLAGEHSMHVRYLSLINAALCKLYPLSPDLLPVTLHFLPLVNRIITKIPLPSVLPSLEELRPSLCLWVRDAQATLSDVQYNTLVAPIYQSTLDLLQMCPLSGSLLRDFADVFVAAFTRPPPPGLGPTAFSAYWRATFLGRKEFVMFYPDALKHCLRAFDDVFGTHLAGDLSNETSSDHTTTPSSVVASSQSPYVTSLAKLSQAFPSAEMFKVDRTHLTNAVFLSPGSDNPFLDSPGPPQPRRPFSALLELAQYSSQTQGQASPQALTGTSRRRSQGNPSLRQSKRGATPLANTPKRRRTSSELEGDRTSPESPHAKFVTSPSARIEAASTSFEAEDDYDSWEVGMSSQDITSIQQALSNRDDLGEDSQILDGTSSPIPPSMTGTELFDDDEQVDEFPEDHSPNAHRRDRSQTEPQVLHHTIPDSARRSAPLTRSRTTSSKLEVLQQAYTIMQDGAEDSQIPLEDFVQAKAIIDRMGTALNEQIQKKLHKAI